MTLEPGLSRANGALLVLATTVLFSFGGLAFRSTDAIDAWEYLFYRGSGMLIATIVVVALRRASASGWTPDVRPRLLVAGVILGAINCIFIVALDLATVAFVLFAQTTAPITAAYFSWLLLREKVSRQLIVATTASMAGVAVMVSGTLTDAVSPAALIVLFIPVGFGLYATLIRSAASMDPTVPIIVAGVTVVTSAALVVGFGSGFEASRHDAVIGLFAGSVLLALPLAVFNTAQRVVPAPETALLLLGEVIMAPLWVWIFVDERPEPTTLIGGALILAAVMWMTVAGSPRRGRPITSRG